MTYLQWLFSIRQTLFVCLVFVIPSEISQTRAPLRIVLAVVSTVSFFFLTVPSINRYIKIKQRTKLRQTKQLHLVKGTDMVEKSNPAYIIWLLFISKYPRFSNSLVKVPYPQVDVLISVTMTGGDRVVDGWSPINFSYKSVRTPWWNVSASALIYISSEQSRFRA